MTLAERINAALQHSALTAAELARKVDVSPSAVTLWRAGTTTKISAEHAYQVARACNVSLVWLLRGDGAMLEEHATQDAVCVALLANAASMGQGSALGEEDVLAASTYLSRAFLRRVARHEQPERLRLMAARGDSMEPTLFAGDILLVDIEQRAPDFGGIYVLRIAGALYCKRIARRIDGALEISSDNPAHRLVEVLDGTTAVDIVARVLYAWRGRAF